ncbi:hypothetical protein, partial [Exiguobacterium sp. s150]|uniref:hypothetical protein n=1 Tax=Exiguobacterium sp. s150 TaxID=2751221 RepID=UPI001BE9C231
DIALEMTKLALHSKFKTYFCLIVQFSKFVYRSLATLKIIQVIDTVVNHFFISFRCHQRQRLLIYRMSN